MGGYASAALPYTALTASLERTGVEPSPAVAILPNTTTAYVA
jgi:hypothetical protein